MNLLSKGEKNQLNYYVLSNRNDMGKYAADLATEHIKKKQKEKEEVRIIFASAPSQDEFLDHLINNKEINWSKIVGFHMDEYIGLPDESDQLFRKYLEEHIVKKVNFKAFHFIEGMKDVNEMKEKYSSLLKEKPIDLCCLGIGENGHIAFNDPPVADFHDPELIKKVALDKYSRQQQVNDGCFNTIEEVPTHALSLTIPALTSASVMVCTVPGPTKKEAVHRVLHDDITTACPATVLREHKRAYLILDEQAYGRE